MDMATLNAKETEIDTKEKMTDTEEKGGPK